MKVIRLFLMLALCLAASMAHAQRVGTAYVVPAVCPYPYGCDVYGNPFPPPYPVYMDGRAQYTSYGTVGVPIAVAVDAVGGRRHGGVSVAVNIIGGLVGGFMNLRR
jgi:hypothetical protein